MKSLITDAFNRLIKIMDELREKCPWDKKQTINTLRQLTIEETYELTDAVTNNDWKAIKEELGDLLLHIVFYAKIGAEQNHFTLLEVINGICEKLIARHPHIYSNVQVNSEEDVKKNWARIKIKEKKDSVLSGVPVSLPSMIKAMRLQEKAGQIGFDWENKEQVWEKVEEEKKELFEAIANNDIKHIEEELGDIFFSLINFARFLQVDAENALERTNKKFIERFTKIESEALNQGLYLHNMTLSQMDALWNKVKKQ